MFGPGNDKSLTSSANILEPFLPKDQAFHVVERENERLALDENCECLVGVFEFEAIFVSYVILQVKQLQMLVLLASSLIFENTDERCLRKTAPLADNIPALPIVIC